MHKTCYCIGPGSKSVCTCKLHMGFFVYLHMQIFNLLNVAGNSAEAALINCYFIPFRNL